MNAVAMPERILLATDLSGRCDRAVTRAAMLASAWHSTLVAAHVVRPGELAERDRVRGTPSWRNPEPWERSLERRLREDLASEGVDASPMVVVGSPAEAVQQAALDIDASLVVLGIAKDAGMTRIQLGSTVDNLVRRARVPVLNVRKRARQPYGHVLIASDFSEPSRHALRLAAHWFGTARLSLFHAYEPPGSSLDGGVAASDAYRARIERQCADHVAAAGLSASATAQLRTVLEQGRAEVLLADYVHSAEVELVVLGSHGRSGVARVLLGSTAEHLLHTLDCDTLVVRGD